MRLVEIMRSPVVTIGSEEPARVAWSLMQRERIRHLVVVDEGRVVGALSERDLGGSNGVEVRSGRLVRELMTTKVASAKPGTTLRQAANVMRGRLIGSLPVVEDGRVSDSLAPNKRAKTAIRPRCPVTTSLHTR